MTTINQASTSTTTPTTTETTIMTNAIVLNSIDLFKASSSSYMFTAAPMLGSQVVKNLLTRVVDDQTGEETYDSEESQVCALLGTNAANITKSVMGALLRNDPWTVEQLEDMSLSMFKTLVDNNNWINLDVDGNLFDAVTNPHSIVVDMENAPCHIVEENGWVVPSRAAYQWMYKMGSISPMEEPVTKENRRTKSVSPRSKGEYSNSFSYIKGGQVKPNYKVKSALQYFESTPYLMDEDMYYTIDRVASKCPEHVEVKTMQYVMTACKELLGKGQLFGEWYTDKRGRFYPLSFGGPNLQTSDLGRSLYSVVSTKALSEEEFNNTGKKYFMQDMKDAWDNKTPLTPKIINFVMGDASTYIIACLTGQIDPKLVAAKPFMFVKMCQDYFAAKAAWANGEKHIFKTPVGLDAKSSGTQILAIIAGAHDVADRCGVTSVVRATDAERKAADPYMFAATVVNQFLAKEGYNFHMTRSDIKTPYMAIQYGGGFKAIMKSQQFRDWTVQLNLDFEGSKDFAGLIIDSIRHSLGERINDFIETVQYNVRKRCEELGVQNFRYHTLDGFPVQTKDKTSYTTNASFYVVFNSSRVGDRVKFGNPETGACWNITGEETVDEFVRKFVVHFIQGTDAMLARTVANKAKEANIEGYASIHDCFRTSVADADKLLGLIQDAYLEIFTDNSIIKSLEEQIGDLRGYVDAEGCWINYSIGDAVDSSLYTADTFYGFC